MEYWLTTKQIVESTGMDRHYIYWLRDNGLLKMGRVGRSYGTTPDELKRFLAWAIAQDLPNEQAIRRAVANKK